MKYFSYLAALGRSNDIGCLQRIGIFGADERCRRISRI